MRKRFFWYLQGILLILCLWWLFSAILGSRLVPPPHPVLPVLRDLLSRGLAAHAAATLGRAAAALCAALLLAFPLGVAMGRVRWLDSALSPLVYLFHPVPKIALLPVVFLLFGLTDLSKIFIVFLVLFFQILIEIRGSVRTIPAEYFRFAVSLGASETQRVRYVILPAILPGVFTAVRIGSGTALAVLFFAETFFASRGLVFFIMDSWMRVAYAEMFAGIVAMGLLGFFLFLLVDVAERLLCPWKRGAATLPGFQATAPRS